MFILSYLQYVSAHNWSKVSSFSFEFFFPIFSPMYLLLLDYVFFPGTQAKTVDPTFYFLFFNLLHDGIDATITNSLCVFCKRNRNIKTYFLGSILSAAKCSVDNYNISKTSNVQNQLWRRVTLTTRNLFLYNKNWFPYTFEKDCTAWFLSWSFWTSHGSLIFA